MMITDYFNCTSWENYEDITLIWLDQTIDLTRTRLREINDYVLLYRDIHIGIESIRLRQNERIYLIISLEYAREYLDEIINLNQIEIIFIFSMNNIEQDQLKENSSKKLIGLFDNEQKLIETIQNELNYFYHQSIQFSFYHINSTEFHWFYLLKDLLHRMSRTDQTQNEMLEQCHKYYHGNDKEFENIELFYRTYTSSHAMNWFIKPTFIYRLLNKAIRIENIQLIYLFRSYLQDLTMKLTINDGKNIVYRGLRLSKDELNNFQLNIGSYIIPKGFLSVTCDYQYALKSILQTSKIYFDFLPIIFRIEINGELLSTSDDKQFLFNLSSIFQIINVSFNDQIWFIDLHLISNQSFEFSSNKIEKFDFEEFIEINSNDIILSSYINLAREKYYQGFIKQSFEHFQIISQMKFNENLFDFIRILNYLALISFEQNSLQLALNYHFQIIEIHFDKQKILPDLILAYSYNSIGIIFIEQYQYEHALKYLFYAMHLFEKHFNSINQSIIAINFNSISLVYYYLKDYTNALEYCLKSLNIRENIFSNTHSLVADSWNNLGLIYHHLYEYDKACEFFQRSLKIYKNDIDRQMRIPICWNNIGLVYLDQYKYDQAIECYFKALNWYLKEENLNNYRDEIEFTYDNLGVAFEMNGDEENALKYYQKALENHSKYTERFVCISMKVGHIFSRKSDYHQALIHYQNALNESKTSSMDFISFLLMLIAIIYHRQHHYQLALNIYQRVLTIRKYLTSKNQLDLAWIYNNISCVYDDIGDINRALKYQEKAHEIRRKSLPSTHLDLAISLTNLGRIHQRIAYQLGGDLWQLEQALLNYKSAFNIRRKSLPMDHPDLAIAYYNLALIHIDQKEFEQAFMEIQKALKIQRKKLSIDHPDLIQTLNLEKQIKFLFCQRIKYLENK